MGITPWPRESEGNYISGDSGHFGPSRLVLFTDEEAEAQGRISSPGSLPEDPALSGDSGLLLTVQARQHLCLRVLRLRLREVS